MAALTFATMLTAVRTRLGNPSTDGFYTDAQIGDLVNEALQVYTTEADWPWLQATTTFPTVAGTATYSPPAGWMKTRLLTIDGYDSMRERSLAEIREVAVAVTGQPDWWALENELINLRPVPNAVYTVIHDYYKIEPELSSTAEPLMPAQFRWALVEYACYLAKLRAGYVQEAQAFKSVYEQWIQKMADHRRRTTGTRKIRVRPGSAL
jgi:hypothetical protein